MLKMVLGVEGDITMKTYKDLLSNLRPITTKLKTNIFPVEPQRKANKTKTHQYEQEYNKFLTTTEKYEMSL